MPYIDVCFSPALYKFLDIKPGTITVVIDILRATTSFCTAFDYGVKEIIPLNSLDEARYYKDLNNLVAAERDGLKPEFADFSNSAFDFMTHLIDEKTIYYTTTNGTAAIEMASQYGKVAIASFLNMHSISLWLSKQNENIILLCAGWKNNFSLEDTLCAGAIADILIDLYKFSSGGDSTSSSIILWNSCRHDPAKLIRESSHYKRLEKLGFHDVLPYSLEIGRSSSIPVLSGKSIINLAKPQINKT